MTILRKNYVTSIIPGDPGQLAIPSSPYVPGYYSNEEVFGLHWMDSSSVYLPDATANEQAFLDDILHAITVQEVSVTKQVYHPPQPAVQGSEGIPPTPSQIDRSLNKGWNSYARSIDKLVAGDYFVCTASNGITGAFMCLGHVGKQGDTIESFPHSIKIEPGGISAYEYGALVETLKVSHAAESFVRIHRQEDNAIVYVVVTGTETVVLKSAVKASVGELYIYGYLYSGGDRITSAALETGRVVFGGTK